MGCGWDVMDVEWSIVVEEGEEDEESRTGER